MTIRYLHIRLLVLGGLVCSGAATLQASDLFSSPVRYGQTIQYDDYRLILNRHVDGLARSTEIFLLNAFNKFMPNLKDNHGRSLYDLATECVEGVLQSIEQNRTEIERREAGEQGATHLAELELRTTLMACVLDMLSHSFLDELHRLEKAAQDFPNRIQPLLPALDALNQDYEKVEPRKACIRAHKAQMEQLKAERQKLREQKAVLTQQLQAAGQ